MPPRRRNGAQAGRWSSPRRSERRSAQSIYIRRACSAYTTYFLTYWSRDAEADRRFELPVAIRKLSRDPAVAVGLLDRGLIQTGYKADLNVIDMDRLHLHAPHATYDLPAGGRRLSQKADGYDATIVSGEITYRAGIATGALPGRLVRGAKEAAA